MQLIISDCSMSLWSINSSLFCTENYKKSSDDKLIHVNKSSDTEEGAGLPGAFQHFNALQI